jgi:5'-AMP-activated protein kinase regulatory beta subunit
MKKNFFFRFDFSDNDFVAILELPEGEHEYKFSIDGRWEYDLNEV